MTFIHSMIFQCSSCNKDSDLSDGYSYCHDCACKRDDSDDTNEKLLGFVQAIYREGHEFTGSILQERAKELLLEILARGID